MACKASSIIATAFIMAIAAALLAAPSAPLVDIAITTAA